MTVTHYLSYHKSLQAGWEGKHFAQASIWKTFDFVLHIKIVKYEFIISGDIKEQ